MCFAGALRAPMSARPKPLRPLGLQERRDDWRKLIARDDIDLVDIACRQSARRNRHSPPQSW